MSGVSGRLAFHELCGPGQLCRVWWIRGFQLLALAKSGLIGGGPPKQVIGLRLVHRVPLAALWIPSRLVKVPEVKLELGVGVVFCDMIGCVGQRLGPRQGHAVALGDFVAWDLLQISVGWCLRSGRGSHNELMPPQ